MLCWVVAYWVVLVVSYHLTVFMYWYAKGVQ